MCRVQKKFGDFRFRKEQLHGEPVIKEADGVMPGGRTGERENRQVILRVGGSEHIQAIAEIPARPVGAPSNVTVRLAVDTVTPAVPDSFFGAAAGTFLTFLCGSVDRCAVPGKRKAEKVDQPVLNRAFKEQPFKDIIKPFTGSHILWGMEPELFQELFYRDLLHWRSLFTFLIGFLRSFLRQMRCTGSERLSLSDSQRRLWKP